MPSLSTLQAREACEKQRQKLADLKSEYRRMLEYTKSLEAQVPRMSIAAVVRVR